MKFQNLIKKQPSNDINNIKVMPSSENIPQIGKKYSLTLTHINPKRKEQLKSAVNKLTKPPKNFGVYQNSL